jgi:hypothetical protein
VDEAAQFLRRMRFSADRGDFAEGERVSILVDPRRDDQGEAFSALITCHAFGHRQVDWEALAVSSAYRAGGGVVSPVVRLDGRGQALFRSLPPGDYALFPHHRTGAFVVPHPAGRGERLAAEARDAEPEGEAPAPVLWHPRTQASADGRVVVTLSPVPSGVEAAFHTGDRGLAGARVAFAFIRADAGLLEGEQEVRLEPVPGAPGVWEGVWQGGVGFEAPGELVFRVRDEE